MLGRSSISVQAITPAHALRIRHKHHSRASGFVHGRKGAGPLAGAGREPPGGFVVGFRSAKADC